MESSFHRILQQAPEYQLHHTFGPALRQQGNAVMHVIWQSGYCLVKCNPLEKESYEPLAADLDSHWRKGAGPLKVVWVGHQ